MEEEKNTDDKEVKSNITLLKPDFEWNCSSCTFLNVNGADKCELCYNAAPIEAFYTQEEIAKLEAEKKAMTIVEETK
jgi:hypothetical protein